MGCLGGLSTASRTDKNNLDSLNSLAALNNVRSGLGAPILSNNMLLSYSVQNCDVQIEVEKVVACVRELLEH